jgi:AcrR family transcriptional regulator
MNMLTAPEGVAPHARDRILHTAHRLFYAHGIRATGIDKVIAEAGVTKVTFYRHFPSKHELILAYLALRHTLWMNWFTTSLATHGHTVSALPPTLKAWFEDKGFRGCAFINVVNEMGEELPAVKAMSRQHKDGMTQAIASLLPPSRQRKATARALAVAVDGAIVHAQMSPDADEALRAFERLCKALTSA